MLTKNIKKHWQTDLTELLKWSDPRAKEEGLSNIRFDSDGKIYRFVKNAGATNLTANAQCAHAFGTATTALDTKKVIVTITGNRGALAGIPVAAIAKSGSNTGDCGWIQIAGLATVIVHGTDTAAIIGAAYVASAGGYFALATAAGTAPTFTRHVVLAQATTSASGGGNEGAATTGRRVVLLANLL